MHDNLSNFQENEVWISKKRVKFRIVSVERDNPVCWYPLLLENLTNKVLFTADPLGKIFLDFRDQDDQLVMQVPSNFGNQPKSEKNLADSMLKIYNARKESMEEQRKKDNEKILWHLRRSKNRRK